MFISYIDLALWVTADLIEAALVVFEKHRKRRGIFYALIIGVVFIASHYMAIRYVEDEGSASFYPPYIEKRVVYPELYKSKAYDKNSNSNNFTIFHI